MFNFFKAKPKNNTELEIILNEIRNLNNSIKGLAHISQSNAIAQTALPNQIEKPLPKPIKKLSKNRIENNEDLIELGRLIKKVRTEKKMTRWELANSIHLKSQCPISNIENGAGYISNMVLTLLKNKLGIK